MVFHTGWNRKMFGDPHYYFDNPFITTELARWLVSKRIKALALDSPQDQVQGKGEPHPGDFPVHRTFLGKGIPFIEHLANLHKVKPRTFTLIAFPIKIEGGDGAPCRAVAMVLRWGVRSPTATPFDDSAGERTRAGLKPAPTTASSGRRPETSSEGARSLGQHPGTRP